jgi:hypothetical protein
MSNPCFKIRGHLLDYHFGELDGLEKERVEAHLGNCAECRTVVERLDRAFSAAAKWQPEPKPGEIDRLVERLTPYLDHPEDEAPPRTRWMYGVGLALAAGVAALLALGPPRPKPATEPEIEAAPLAVVDAPVQRVAPTERVRVVSSVDWNGRVRKAKDTTRIEMEQGFAVIAFDGGEGQKLAVVTPDVEIQVIGTRFYVDARPGIPTTVGVIAGRVEIHTKKKKKDVLVAGSERAYQPDGSEAPVELARTKPYHSDPYLGEAPMIAEGSRDGERTPAIAKAPPPRSKLLPRLPTKLLPRKEGPVEANRTIEALPPEPEALDGAEVLEDVEKLVREGRLEGALELIDDALSDDDPALSPFGPTLRYERARILLKQGKRDQARIEFGRLTQAPLPEVAHQASLSLCELELVEDPCSAAACLRSVDSREAKELLARWRLAELDCDHDNKK